MYQITEVFYHIINKVYDDEGDEEVGKVARQAMVAKDEQEKYIQIMRCMRDDCDGPCRGVVYVSLEARRQYWFDNLIALNNRESTNVEGLLVSDEFFLKKKQKMVTLQNW